MGWEDRDYSREESSVGFAHRLSGHSAVTWLLVVNCIVFVLDAILTGSSRAGTLSPTFWGCFNVDLALRDLQVWRWFTYQFLHLDFFHLLFNMIGLYFFGPLMEQWWGSRRFVAFYLLCGACGAVVFTLLSFVPGLIPSGRGGILVGASGSIFAILVGCAALFPRHRVQLIFPPIPMSMRTMAMIFLGLAVISLAVGSRNAGGEAAHLGGAALGFLFVKSPRLLGWVERLRLPRRDPHQRWERQARQAQQDRMREQAEVDRILDKVREHGLHSLTRAEKRALQRATDRQRQAG